jgi:hypothetical protein
MDNKLNEIRNKISFLRSEMLLTENAIRKQINRDEDFTEASLRLMAMRVVSRRSTAAAMSWPVTSSSNMSETEAVYWSGGKQPWRWAASMLRSRGRLGRLRGSRFRT